MEYSKLEWRCVNCNEVLSAFMQSTLEILIRAHNHVHSIESEKKSREPWNDPAAVQANRYIGEPIRTTRELPPVTPEDRFIAALTDDDKKFLQGIKVGY